MSTAEEEQRNVENGASQSLSEEELCSLLTKLCSLSEDDAAKVGKLKGSSLFKLSWLKLLAKKRGLVLCLSKPEMITQLRASVKKEDELNEMDAVERNGTYRHDKKPWNCVLVVPVCSIPFYCIHFMLLS
jgi:hypothetical protein